MGNRRRPIGDERPDRPMRQLIDLPEDGDGAKAEARLEMMRRRAQRGDPEAALHILTYIVRDIPPDEEDQR